MKYILLIGSLLASGILYSQQTVDNIFLITLDGVRWQELYGGAVDSMLDNESMTIFPDEVMSRFKANTKKEARELLMPFFWNTISKEGQLYGNRWLGNKMTCSNRFWFSYPGYNEILTGFTDPLIDSNDKVYNKNKTVLEWLHDKPEFKGKVAAFASWDVFPFIINDVRSGIPVNAGFKKSGDEDISEFEKYLNLLQDDISGPWHNVRLDAFTHHYMMEYVKKHHPRVVYISYGETDDFAHGNRYDQYLLSAYKTDQWIKDLWSFIQQDEFYKYKTSLIITTDHGRGTIPMTEWTSHGNIYKGSNEIWAAAIGPNVPATGVIKTDELLLQSQIAKTLAKMLGYDYQGGKYQAGDIISNMIKD